MIAPDADLLHAFRAAVDAHIGRELRRDTADVNALRDDVLGRLAVNIGRARAKGLVGRVWLFGSFAWGTPHAASDVDLLLEDADDPFMAAAVIESGLERAVDVIRIERAPAELRRRVLAEGISL